MNEAPSLFPDPCEGCALSSTEVDIARVAMLDVFYARKENQRVGEVGADEFPSNIVQENQWVIGQLVACVNKKIMSECGNVN